jgi:hypothetical protein
VGAAGLHVLDHLDEVPERAAKLVERGDGQRVARRQAAEHRSCRVKVVAVAQSTHNNPPVPLDIWNGSQHQRTMVDFVLAHDPIGTEQTWAS